MADKIRIGSTSLGWFEFGVLTQRPNPLTNPIREYIHDGAGKLTSIIERVSLNCWFVYEPDEIWSKFDEIREKLENGIMDFEYYRDSTKVLELRRIDHVASPRFSNITPSGTPGTLANHINFTMDVIAEKGSLKGGGHGTKVLSMDRTVRLSSKPREIGGEEEVRSATARGEKAPSLSIIDSHILDPEFAQAEDLDVITYEYRKDQLGWVGTATYRKRPTAQPGGGQIETWTETISVAGGGGPISYFQRTGSRLPLPFLGKKRPVIITISGAMEGANPLGLRIPQRVGGSGPDATLKIRNLGKSGATEYEISVSRTYPDGSPKTFRLSYRETYKRSIEEDNIFGIVQNDYALSTIQQIAAGITPFPIGAGVTARQPNPFR